MLNKVKNWLGIEGVKANVLLDEPLKATSTELNGTIQLYTIRQQKIESLRSRLVERYKRGRKEAMRIDEYSLGAKELLLNTTLAERETKDIPFSLNLSFLQSNMDKMAQKNVISRGIVKLLKKQQAVSSSYRLEVTVMGTGAAIDPAFKFPIEPNKKNTDQ